MTNVRDLSALLDPSRRFTTAHGQHCVVRIERHYDADPADVWDACVKADRLARWLGVLESVPAEGESATVIMTPPDQHPVKLTVLRCDRPNRLVVIWGWPEAPDSYLDLRIKPAPGGGADVVFEHLDIAADEILDYGHGWEAFLARLDAELTPDRGPVPTSAEIEELTKPLWLAEVPKATDRWPTLDADRRSICARHEFAAAPEVVWAAITEADQLNAWCGRFEGGADGWTLTWDSGAASGTVSERVDGRRLVTSWRWDVESASSTVAVVSVDLSPTADGGTTLTLLQENVTGSLDGYGAGWHAHLESLAAHLGGSRRTEADWQTDWTLARAMIRP